jgi:DNA-directed RNA polymerase specialized sigma24 family protein
VTQSLLLAIPQKVRSFDRQPGGSPPRRFRSWLKAVVRNALVDFARGAARGGRGAGGSSLGPALEAVEAQRDLVERLSDLFDLELLDEAMDRVRRRVQPATWAAFRLSALEGRPGKEAAAALSMPVAHVHVHRSRVQALIQEELQTLGEEGDEVD